MRKCMKCALEKEQIIEKNSYTDIDGYEIHLYGDSRDDFSLASLMTKPIVTVHYPLDRCNILQIAKEQNDEYANKVFQFCRDYHAGLVLHVESSAKEIINQPEIIRLCGHLKIYDIKVYVENFYKSAGIKDALAVYNYIRPLIGEKSVFPLLDICHMMISQMDLTRDELSFAESLNAFQSDSFKIHLSDCVGSGEWETGGIHGDNFKTNRYFLENILTKLMEMEKNGCFCDCILEVDESDYIHNPNAHNLAVRIDEFFNRH